VWDSLDKVLTAIEVVAQVPILYKGMEYQPPVHLYVSDKFWKSYICKKGCGGCCLNFSLDWLPSGWEEVEKEYLQVAELHKLRNIEVNRVRRSIATISPEGNKHCRFFDDIGCMIHKYRPLTCRTPLIKFHRVGDRGYIFKSPFGRAWAMKRFDGGPILCELGAFSPNQFLDNDVPVLRRLLSWCNHFGIETHLPRIIDLLMESFESGVMGRIDVTKCTQEGRLF